MRHTHPIRDRQPVLVTGGTGTLGRLVVRRLLDAGRTVRVLSRHAGEGDLRAELVPGDLASGQGVEAAIDGAPTIVHLAGSAKGDERKAETLALAAERAGARHLIYISVVGADRIPMAGPLDRAMFGYFASKLEAERVVADSGVPWTVLRATQFHQSLFRLVAGVAKLPLIPLPSGFRFQPVDAEEVAERLVGLSLGPPAGRVPDLAGPDVVPMTGLVRAYLRATDRRRPIAELPMPGKAAAAFRAGANLPIAGDRGLIGWDDFLALRLAGRTDTRGVQSDASSGV